MFIQAHLSGSIVVINKVIKAFSETFVSYVKLVLVISFVHLISNESCDIKHVILISFSLHTKLNGSFSDKNLIPTSLQMDNSERQIVFRLRFLLHVVLLWVSYFQNQLMFKYICKDLAPVFINVSYAILHQDHVNGSLFYFQKIMCCYASDNKGKCSGILYFIFFHPVNRQM